MPTLWQSPTGDAEGPVQPLAAPPGRAAEGPRLEPWSAQQKAASCILRGGSGDLWPECRMRLPCPLLSEAATLHQKQCSLLPEGGARALAIPWALPGRGGEGRGILNTPTDSSPTDLSSPHPPLTEQLQQKDKQIVTLLEEKEMIFRYMTDCGGPEDSPGTRTLFRANTEEAPKGGSVMKSVIREGEQVSASRPPPPQVLILVQDQQIDLGSRAFFQASVLQLGCCCCCCWVLLCVEAGKTVCTAPSPGLVWPFCSEAGHVPSSPLLRLKCPPRGPLQCRLPWAVPGALLG